MPRVDVLRNLRERAPVVLATALVVHGIIAASAFVHRTDPMPDFDRYHAIGTASGRAYIDYRVEHPIATWAVFRTLAADRPDVPTFGGRIILLNVLADAAIAAAIAWAWGIEAAAAYALISAPIFELLVNRIDLWSTACATFAVAAWWRGRLNAAAVAIAAGCAFKLWPLLFAPLLLVPLPWHRARRAGLQPIGVFLATAAAIAIAWWWVAGVRGLYDVLTFRGARGWQIESTVGALLNLAHAPSLRLESGSWRIGSTSGTVSIALFAIAAPLSLWIVWQGARRRRVGAGWLGGVSTLLALSALLSAQFAAWLAPGAAIAWAEEDYANAGLGFLAIFLTEMFWVFYEMVIAGLTVPRGLVVFRNVVLLILAGNAVRTVTAR